MGLYKYLKETLLLDELRRTMIPHLHKVQELIEEYYYSDKESDLDFILESIIKELNDVISQLSQLDYTYEPEVTPDVNEEIFTNTLLRYRNQISDFISHFSEDKFEAFGEWLKIKSGNAKDKKFVEGFVTASLTVCIGAMAIVGAIQDGILGDYSVLVTKSILDLIIVMVMTCSWGKGCAFSAIPVAILQGGVTALSAFIKPIMTPEALANLSMIGSILIFCVGLNLVWGKKIRVANLLPAIVFAVAAAFLPFEL